MPNILPESTEFAPVVPEAWKNKRVRRVAKYQAEDGTVHRIATNATAPIRGAAPTWSPNPATTTTEVRPQFGAGGFVVGVREHSGTLLTRTDVGGSYLRDDPGSASHLFLTRVTDPTKPHYAGGLYNAAAAFAPSDKLVAYVMGGNGDNWNDQHRSRFYCTTDGGVTVKESDPPIVVDIPAGSKRLQHRMAVDPRNPHHVLYGSFKNVWETFNAQDDNPTWTELTATPCDVTATDGFGSSWVYFNDQAGALTATHAGTGRLYTRQWLVSTTGSTEGLWRTDDGGATFPNRIRFWNNDGSENTMNIVFDHARPTATGPLFVIGWRDCFRILNPFSTVAQTPGVVNEQTQCVMSLRSASVAGPYRPSFAKQNNLRGIGFKPGDPNVLLLLGDVWDGAGSMFMSHNVTTALDGGQVPTFTNRNPTILDGDGTQWVAEWSKNRFTIGGMVWTANGVYVAEGLALWKIDPTDPGLSSGGTGLTFRNFSKGIEMLVTHSVCHLPAMTVDGTAVPARDFAAVWDKGIIVRTSNGGTWDVHPKWMDDAGGNPSGHSIAVCPEDFSRMAFIVDAVWGGMTNPSGDQKDWCVSVDGGQTITRMDSLVNGTHPASLKYGEMIFGSTPDVLIASPSEGGPIHMSPDFGRTWIAGAGLPTGTSYQVYNNNYLRRQVLCRDGVNKATIYALNQAGSTQATWNGVIRSTDDGRNWHGMNSTGLRLIGKQFAAAMKTVPGQAGMLFVGLEMVKGDTATQPLRQSVDGGATFTDIPAIQDAYRIAVGPGPGGSGQRIWVWCADPDYSAQPNPWLYRAFMYSDDLGATWTKYDNYILGNFDAVTCLATYPESRLGLMAGYNGTTVGAIEPAAG